MNLDSYELLLLKVLVSDEILVLESRIKFWKENDDEDNQSIIDYNESKLITFCKLYQKLLKCEV